MRILSLILALSGALGAATQNVSSGNFFYSPNSVNINVGDTVQWSGLGSGHNVAQSTDAGSNSYDGSGFRSGDTNSGVSTFSFQFNTPGTYFYVCENHAGANMKGQVVVAAVGTATMTPTFSPTPSITPTFSATPVLSPTPTLTPAPTSAALSDIRAAAGMGFGINSPKRGEDLCVVFEKQVLAASVLVYNFGGQRVALVGDVLRNPCVKTTDLAPGIYFLKVEAGLNDGSTLKFMKKAMIIP